MIYGYFYNPFLSIPKICDEFFSIPKIIKLRSFANEQQPKLFSQKDFLFCRFIFIADFYHGAH